MTTKQKNSIRVGKYVNTGHVDAVIREYKRTRWVPNSERIGKPDSLSAWLSTEDLEDFLAATKKYGGDGIKFYFSAYPADYAPNPEYAGRQTITLVATRSKNTGMGTVANKDIYITKHGQSTVLGFNNLAICPPICNSSSEGGMGDLGITILDKGANGMEIA
ncbi:MAG TPA: hypothetical protein DIC22_05440 [Chitinophagaceae bacterium]|jgi:hypothetical protein|nr:hypothetical protein [Chitinophagaceae bacterium]